MARSKISETNIDKGIPLSTLSATEVGALANDSIYLNSVGSLCIKKVGVEKSITTPTGQVSGLSGINISAASTPSVNVNTAPTGKLIIGGTAVASITEDSSTHDVTVILNDTGTGGGGGGSPTGNAGSGGGDLAGTYPDPTLKTISGVVGSYQLPGVTLDNKGRVTVATSLGSISSAQNGETLVFDSTTSLFKNKQAPYKNSVYETERVVGGFSKAFYDTLAITNPFTASGSTSAVYDITQQKITVGNGSILTLTSPIICDGVFRIMLDTTVAYSTRFSINNGASWSAYSNNSLTTLSGGTTNQFLIEFTFSSIGVVFGYGLLHGTSLPIGNKASTSIVDNSSFTGNLNTNTKTVQDLANTVDGLSISGGLGVNLMTMATIDGSTIGATALSHKNNIIPASLTLSGGTGVRITLPSLATLQVGDELSISQGARDSGYSNTFNRSFVLKTAGFSEIVLPHMTYSIGNEAAGSAGATLVLNPGGSNCGITVTSATSPRFMNNFYLKLVVAQYFISSSNTYTTAWQVVGVPC